MAKWKQFEESACAYLNEKFEHLNVIFKNTGFSDSTSNDIQCFYNGRLILSIEAKYLPSQSGQFVVKEVNQQFQLTNQQKSKANKYTYTLIDHLNNNFPLYEQAKEKAVALNVQSSDLAEWVKEHYKNKEVTYVITSHEIDGYKAVLPLDDFQHYFDVSATLRPKQSGTSYVSKANYDECVDQLESYAIHNNIEILDIQSGKKPYVVLDADFIPKSKRYIGEKYFLSETGEQNKYYLKQRASTKNLNVVFSVDYKGERVNYGLSGLEQYIVNIIK